MDDLTSAQRGAIEALKASRGPCPSAETLVVYESLSPEARGNHAAHDHISICSRCQLALLHMAEPVSASRVRWILPLAALLVIAIAGVLMRNGGVSSTPADIVRGTEIQAVAPIGSVDTLTEFSWQSPVRVDRYRVIVTRGSDRIWSGETAASRIDAPANLFDANVEYRWTVEAIDREGDVRMTSPSQSFTWSRRR